MLRFANDDSLKSKARRKRMKCYIVNDLLPEYIEDLCGEETKKEIDKHIAGCKKCQETLKNMTVGEKGEVKEGEDITPFKRIQDKIKKTKRKKRIVTVSLVIVCIVFVSLAVFQFCPWLDGPNYDKLMYRIEAEKIAKEFEKGNVKILLDGYINLADSCFQVNFEQFDKEKKIYEGCANRLEEIFKETFQGKEIKTKVESIHYEQSSYYNYSIKGEDQTYQTYPGMYSAEIKISVDDEKSFNLFLIFMNKNCYISEISFQNYYGEEEVIDYTKPFNANVDQFSQNLYSYQKNILRNDTRAFLCERALKNENRSDTLSRVFSRQFTTDCIKITNPEIWQSDEYSEYHIKMQEKINAILAHSATKNFKIVNGDYIKEKNIFQGTLYWDIQDKNGNKAVMTKEFYVGPYGYQPVDEEEEILTTGEFDKELLEELKEIFTTK